MHANLGAAATSNDAWGPTGTQMAEIAQLTFNSCVALVTPHPPIDVTPRPRC